MLKTVKIFFLSPCSNRGHRGDRGHGHDDDDHEIGESDAGSGMNRGNNLEIFSGNPTSTSKTTSSICVCEAVTPVLRYCQFFGISPISLRNRNDKDDTNEDQDVNENFATVAKTGRKNCCISSTSSNSRRWLSLPSMSNLLLLFGFLSITTWVIFRIHTVLKVYFDGTDLYTFGTQTVCLYSQCILILLNALVRRHRFCELWTLLLKILGNLGENEKNTEKFPVSRHLRLLEELSKMNSKTKLLDVEPDPEVIPLGNGGGDGGSQLRQKLAFLRIFSAGAVVTVLILSVAHTICFINLVFHGCLEATWKDLEHGHGVTRELSGKPPCPFGDFFLFLQKFFYGMIDFVQQGVAILFCVLCLVVYTFFKEVERQLERALFWKQPGNGGGHGGGVGPEEIEKLRMTYEDLGRACRLLSSTFGLGVLAVMISATVSITCALYSIALYSGGIGQAETLKIARFYVIWAFHGWFGCFSLALVLIPAQMISNASEAPSQVIGRCSLINLDNETKHQLFQLQQMSSQKVVLTACNVANIGVGFIGAAATNVTTYILVILQFRLGVEKNLLTD